MNKFPTFGVKEKKDVQAPLQCQRQPSQWRKKNGVKWVLLLLLLQRDPDPPDQTSACSSCHQPYQPDRGRGQFQAVAPAF